MRQIFEYFGLDEGTTDFIGHALALQQTEDYLNQVRPVPRQHTYALIAQDLCTTLVIIISHYVIPNHGE